MIYIVLNLSAILAATVAGLAFGALWLTLSGERAIRQARHEQRTALFLTASLAEFWLAAILAGALILAPSKASAATMAFGSAVVIWIGFVVPVLVVTHRYRGLPVGAAVRDCVHWLGVMLVQTAVLGAIGLVPPPS